jgi:deazaflavin-dependent oxidoreductase (nitroreductase family)
MLSEHLEGNMMESLRKTMPASLQTIYPKNKLGKFIFHLPIYAWRLGLGPIVGRYIMIITHTGRKTGFSRHTAVEYHRLGGIKYIPCAFGFQAQWYRNIMANPRVTIQTAEGTEHMVAVRVTRDEELVLVIQSILKRNPTLMNWYLQSLGVEPTETDILAHKEHLIFLRFDPTNEPAPRGLEVDLAWIWPLIMLWMFISRPFRHKRK